MLQGKFDTAKPHLIVWDVKCQKWLVVKDNIIYRFALKIALLEFEDEHGGDITGKNTYHKNEKMTTNSASTALINIHNLLKSAWRKWENICRGID